MHEFLHRYKDKNIKIEDYTLTIIE